MVRSDEDWEIDCGLMATLAEQHGGGNCDDLASYALDYGMRNHAECVLAFTQHDRFHHSFVLTYCKGDADVWLADVWVRQDRAIKFTEAVWCTPSNLDCRVMLVAVASSGYGRAKRDRRWPRQFGTNRRCAVERGFEAWRLGFFCGDLDSTGRAVLLASPSATSSRARPGKPRRLGQVEAVLERDRIEDLSVGLACRSMPPNCATPGRWSERGRTL
jgi:hypothetical protein